MLLEYSDDIPKPRLLGLPVEDIIAVQEAECSLGCSCTWPLRLNHLVCVEWHPCSRWEFSQRNGEQERSDMGESVFPETDPISLFWGLLIYLLLHIGMNTESRGGQQS